MASYKRYGQLNLPETDKRVAEFWNTQKIFEKSISEREGAESFVFYEGPPSANGKPGIHHVLARSIKDTFCRFQTMKGKLVKRKGGWDTHGLPIELSVEKRLGITKEDIGDKISVEAYNEECRKTVMQYRELWDDITRKMGYWVDLNEPYVTYENNYIESVWFLLRRLYDKNMLYKGYTVQPFSPAAGTGLSSHELNQPGCYKEVKDTTVVAQFRAVLDEKSKFLFEDEKEDVCFIAWTTTPWTLPSNTALGVGKKIDYVKVKTFNKYTGEPLSVVLAEALLSKWFEAEGAELAMDSYEAGSKTVPYRVVQSFKGAQLEGLSYEQLLPYQQPEDGDAFRVLLGDFVSTEDGTGIVHLAPSFGADDRLTAQKYGIGSLTLVNKQGRFTEGVGEFSGRYVKNYRDAEDFVNVDIDIAVKLKLDNKAFNVQKYEHNYPHCWRTDKPVLYYPLDSWFIRSTAAKDRMVELNNTINWKPASTGTGRFGNWLENLQDWNLSRSRFWGIPLPIWRSADGEEEICIGSVGELRAEVKKAVEAGFMEKELPEDFDLHRPYIDDVVLVAPSGKKMQREPDLIDVWFDSGSMPYAQWHYPFENADLIDNALENKEGERAFPADFIAEGVDQTRGWFYTLHAIATMCFDSVAYKNVVSNGLVLDKQGKKMSKRLGNAVDPFETIAKYGADATRWYMLTNAQPWDNLRFDIEGLAETQRKLFGTLFHTYDFFAQYANLDNFSYEEEALPLSERREIDRWIISFLNTLVKEVEADYSNYEPTSAGRRIQTFVLDHLSNWYVRLSRARFWKGEGKDKVAAYQTLYEVLITIAKLMAPIAPFFTEELYRNLNGVSQKEPHESVHLADFPAYEAERVDKDLEQRMDYAQRICSLVHSLRKRESLRVRQPLQRILLPVLDSDFQEQVEQVKDIILTEVNVKEIEYVTDTTGIIKKGISPNFRTLGRRLGKDMKAGKQVIEGLSQDEIAEFEEKGEYLLEVNGNEYKLTLEDVEISSEDLEGWLVANDGKLTVALDNNVTEELRLEGVARELINRIQNLRKQKDFELDDRIHVVVEKTEDLEKALAEHKDYVAQEVLAKSIELSETVANGESVDFLEDTEIQLSVEVLG